MFRMAIFDPFFGATRFGEVLAGILNRIVSLAELAAVAYGAWFTIHELDWNPLFLIVYFPLSLLAIIIANYTLRLFCVIVFVIFHGTTDASVVMDRLRSRRRNREDRRQRREDDREQRQIERKESAFQRAEKRYIRKETRRIEAAGGRVGRIERRQDGTLLVSPVFTYSGPGVNSKEFDEFQRKVSEFNSKTPPAPKRSDF